MIRIAVSALVVGLSSFAISSQVPAPQGTPDPYEAQRMIRRTEQNNRRFEALRSGRREVTSFDRRIRNPLLHQHFRELYRKPDNSEISLLKPSVGVRARYREFLKGTGSGLIVLAPNFDCAKNAIVINAAERCVKLDFPGAGSSYSFRYGHYRIPRLSDISFTGESFLTVGDFTQGIVTAIGDVPIEQIRGETLGMAFLKSFAPARQLDEAAELDGDFINGVERDGFTYKRSWKAMADTTYLLRSIAYRGQSIRMFENVTYDEFEFDKRRDVTVAFRVVEHQPDGSVTIVWKKLVDEKSPTIGSLTAQ